VKRLTTIYGEEMRDYLYQTAFEFDQKEIIHYKLHSFDNRKLNRELSHSAVNLGEKIINTFQI